MASGVAGGWTCDGGDFCGASVPWVVFTIRITDKLLLFAPQRGDFPTGSERRNKKTVTISCDL